MRIPVAFLFRWLLALAAIQLIEAQTVMLAKYGSRSPTICPSRKDPSRGASSSAQAVQYFVRDNEVLQELGTRNTVFLVTDVKVEIGKARPFDMSKDTPPAYHGISTVEKVYEITGSFIKWTCAVAGPETGKNCMRSVQDQAVGICYKDWSADWHCRMMGRGETQFGQSPPTK
jgi:hypothetical protein